MERERREMVEGGREGEMDDTEKNKKKSRETLTGEGVLYLIANIQLLMY